MLFYFSVIEKLEELVDYPLFSREADLCSPRDKVTLKTSASHSPLDNVFPEPEGPAATWNGTRRTDESKRGGGFSRFLAPHLLSGGGGIIQNFSSIRPDLSFVSLFEGELVQRPGRKEKIYPRFATLDLLFFFEEASFRRPTTSSRFDVRSILCEEMYTYFGNTIFFGISMIMEWRKEKKRVGRTSLARVSFKRFFLFRTRVAAREKLSA